MSIGLRTIASETRVMLNKQVLVVLSNGKKYKGILASLDPETLHICLLDAKEMSGDGKKISRLVLNGSVVSEVAAEEGGLPMRNRMNSYLKSTQIISGTLRMRKLLSWQKESRFIVMVGLKESVQLQNASSRLLSTFRKRQDSDIIQ